MTRRTFLQTTAAGAAFLAAGRRAYAFSQSPSLQKFMQPLAGLGPAGIPVASPDALTYPGVDFYRIRIGEFYQQLHPQLPKATRLWGYADVTNPAAPANFRHLGGVIVAQRGRPVRISVQNALPMTPPPGYAHVHPLPVDTSIPGADPGQLENRTAVHLHGGFSPWVSDGTPFQWFAPNGTMGPSRVPWLLDAAGAPTFDLYYPNLQSARLMWYHDHAMGITRLNAYAGVASAYVIREPAEAVNTSGYDALGLAFTSRSIPARELPLVIQDKIFVNAALPDPLYTWGAPGDLWYPYIYDRNRWKLNGNGLNGPGGAPVPSCIPEFFGDTMLVNGLVYPDLTVEPTRYRLRILNACNARFCTLRLALAQASATAPGSFPASTEPQMNAATGQPVLGPGLVQIGSEGGFLPAPAVLNGATPATTLLLAPAERADLIVDFSGLAPGTTLLLYNDAPAPYPMGAPVNDYFPGAPKNPTVTLPGFGPNSRTLMRFVVGALTGPPDPGPATLTIPSGDPLLVPLGVTTPPPGFVTRDLTLNEDFDIYGRLMQRIGTNVPLYKGTFARNYMDPATETPQAGTIEIWRIANLTADTHPVHFHLVNVQVISRQLFAVNKYNGIATPAGPAVPPDPNEAGWKETVRMNPGEVTTVIARFDLPPAPAGAPPLPLSPRTGGHEYVWHCHILEHEEHDMMRPLVVL